MTDAFAGAGVVESVAGLNQTINAESEGETEKVLDVTFASIDAAASIASTVVDPLGSVIAAGVGWLFEHVSILREPLDALMGDPDEIQAHTESLKQHAEEVKQVADQHRDAVQAFQGWAGEAAEAFRKSMQQLADEYTGLSESVATTANIAAVNGTLVITLRDLVRDMIVELITTLIEGALVAVSTAVITFGASIAGFVAYTIGRVAALGVEIGAKIAKLIAAFARQGTRLAKLGDAMGDLTKNFGRFADAAGVASIGNDVGQAATSA